MDNNTEYANDIASDESMTRNDENETTIHPEEDDDSSRSFGTMDMWNIRRSARKFKIHDRIPRL